MPELGVDHERGNGAENNTSENRAAAEQLHPMINHAVHHQLTHADGRGVSPGCTKRAVDLALSPRGNAGDDGENDGGRVLGRRRLKRLSTDDEADIEQDRQDRDQWHHRQQQRRQAQETDQRDDDAGGQRIADTSANRLPARMADIDRGRKRAAEDRADDGADAVGKQDVAQAVIVTRRRGAFDVVHAFSEIIDAERDRGDKQRRYVGEAPEHIAADPRQPYAKLGEGGADLAGFHHVAPAEHGDHPRDYRADDHRRETARDAERQPNIGGPADQDDAERNERYPRHLPHLERGTHRDVGDGYARERAEHGRTRREAPDGRPDERADQHDDADDKGPCQARFPCQQRVL